MRKSGAAPGWKSASVSVNPSRGARRRLVAGSLAILAIGTGVGACASSPKDSAAHQSAAWPPVEDPEFRRELLYYLTRGASIAPDLRDVTQQKLNLSFADFCNMPENRRRHFYALSLARIIPTFYDEIMSQFHKECGLEIYSQRRSDGDVYVAIYNNDPGGDDKIYLTRSERAVLALVRASKRTSIPKLATKAARAARGALKQRADR
jgi:hypothetical protein